MKATLASIAALVAASAVSAAPANMEKRCSPYEVFPSYLANSPDITYAGGGWTVLTNQGSRDVGGTEAYSNAADA